MHRTCSWGTARQLFAHHRQSIAAFATRSGRSPRLAKAVPQAALRQLRGVPFAASSCFTADHEGADMGKGKSFTNKVNTSCYIQVLGLGTDTGDSAPSVLLFFDHYRFLFNAGEGFQRFCVQHKVKMGKTSSIFVTRSSTAALGGLPGMLLTMADMGPGVGMLGTSGVQMSLYGPSGLATLTAAVRTFVNTASMGLKEQEFGMAAPPAAGQEQLPPLLQNEVVTITPAVLHPAEAAATEGGAADTAGAAAGATEKADEASADGEPAAKRQRMELGANGEGLLDGQVLGSEQRRPAACYMCKLADIPGKFQPAKAQELMVRKGKDYAALVRGESVTATDGTTVRPEQVLAAGAPGPVALVVDAPTEAYLPALLAHPTLKRCQPGDGAKDGADGAQAAAVVVHLSPADVVALPAYQGWMAACGPDTQHIVVNSMAPGSGPVMMRSAATIHARLNVLAPALFPLPPPPPPAGPKAQAAEGVKSADGQNLLKYWLRPVARQGIDSGEVAPAFDAAAVQAELQRTQPEVVEAARAYHEAPPAADGEGAEAVPEAVRTAGREELEIVFLGTGAAIPAKYRNVTGIYLNLFARGGLMLDCGEGSYGQLVRRYGPQGAARAVASLAAVWISHIHADHHSGLPRLLAVRRQVLGPAAAPLLVLGPRPLQRALRAYAQLEPLTFRYLDTSHTVAGAAPEQPEALEAFGAAKAKLGLTRLESVRVHHCAQAFGVALTSQAGWSLAFSGDTRPCEALAVAAKDATVLIHEATFEDELAEEALAKRHSLTHEAIEIGRKAGAYRTILTHFSQRYAKLPVIEESFDARTTGIAFDLMSVNLADLPALPRLLPALQLLFRQEEPDAEAAEEAEAAENAAGL